MLLRPSALLAAATGLIGCTVAGKIINMRDFVTISGALDNVNALMLQMNEHILNLDANNIATAGPAIVQLGQVIQPSLQGMSAQVAAATPLSEDETKSLNTARVALDQNVNLTINDLIGQKPLFDTAALSPTVATILQQVRDGSEGLFTAITSKLAPTAAETNSVTADLFSQALVVFDMAIAVFGGRVEPPAVPASVPRPPAGTVGTPLVPGVGIVGGDGACVCTTVCPVGSFVMAA